MDKKLIKKRQFYFGFLFLSFIYFGIAMLVVKQAKPLSFDLFQEVLIVIAGLIPAVLFFLRKKYETKKYLFLLAIGQIPIVLGFLLSILYENLFYLIIMFPVFILGYLVIIPVKEKQ